MDREFASGAAGYSLIQRLCYTYTAEMDIGCNKNKNNSAKYSTGTGTSMKQTFTTVFNNYIHVVICISEI